MRDNHRSVIYVAAGITVVWLVGVLCLRWVL